MKFKIFTIILFFSFLSSYSQKLTFNKEASSITFAINNFGFAVKGNFNDFTFTSNFNPSNLKNSFINAEISVKSIFTDSKSRDNHLLKSDFFDVKNYPIIVFNSSKIEKKENGSYLLKGILKIKGVEKTVATILELKETDKEIFFLTDFEINRKDFGVGGSSFILSKTVNIKMKYVANRN